MTRPGDVGLAGAAMTSALLELEHVSTFYGDSQALFGMSLTVRAAEVVSLLGRNGMGKTTTVHSIMGITPPRAGRLAFRGRLIRGWPPYRVARAGIALVPEGRHVFPNLTVRENLVATAVLPAASAASAAWTVDRVLDLFPALRARLGMLGATLSGGEQQMVAIGRALMTNPRLLLLDEATEGLAPLVRAQIWECVATLKASGLAILIVDKHVATLGRLADRHYIVEKGRVAWTGTSADLAADAGLRHRFLGV
jgi:branched-chain amino acid transport system ATP-binding protein